MSEQSLSAKRSNLSRFIEEAENNYKVSGAHNVPVQYFSAPGEEVEDRDLDQNHVAKLAREFQLHGTNNQNIEAFVLFDTQAWKNLPAQPLEGFASLQAFLDAQPEGQNKLRVHIGWHSTNAIKVIHQRHPNNKKFKTIRPKAVYFVPNDSDGIRFLRRAGALDNRQHALHRKTPVWYNVKNLHRELESIRLSTNTEQDRRQKESQLKDDIINSTSIAPNQYGQFKALAKQTGGVWEKITAIFEGNVVKSQRKSGKKFKPPKSCAPFVLCAGIPQQTLESMLQEVISGTMEVTNFKESCVRVKAELRLRKEALNICKVATWKKVKKRLGEPVEALVRRYIKIVSAS